MRFLVIIPARLGSTRLFGKALATLHGRPMISWVIQRSLASGAAQVVVATDDDSIADVARACGADVCMTSKLHQNGTERLAEAVNVLLINDDEIVVNVQGDEPLIDPGLIRDVAAHLDATLSDVATAAARIFSMADFLDSNVVKVVTDSESNAMYFSRAPIPARRDLSDDLGSGAELGMLRHTGIYAYRASTLRRYSHWKECQLEQLEKLEQLRLLWHGARIAVLVTTASTGMSIDTIEDLERARGIDISEFEHIKRV